MAYCTGEALLQAAVKKKTNKNKPNERAKRPLENKERACRAAILCGERETHISSASVGRVRRRNLSPQKLGIRQRCVSFSYEFCHFSSLHAHFFFSFSLWRGLLLFRHPAIAGSGIRAGRPRKKLASAKWLSLQPTPPLQLVIFGAPRRVWWLAQFFFFVSLKR